MHPTIHTLLEAAPSGDHSKIAPLLAPDVRFLPPTYFATWTGRDAVAAVLGHVGQVFSDFSYRRVMGAGNDWALEFQCKVGDLDAVGVDLLTLNDDGLVCLFEVAMRPYKTIGALRNAMALRVQNDPDFARHRAALS
jgi:hypothetical protein